MMTHGPELLISQSPTARVEKMGENSWRLEIPAHAKAGYRLAQLDDHGSQRQRNITWKPPLTLSLQARASAEELPGTWGFGFWNDPLSFLFGHEGWLRRLPSLPDAAWFFHASPQNYLSFRDDLPACGFMAATFSAVKIPALWLALASPTLAFALIPGAAQLIRRALRRVVHQDAAQILTRVTEWHSYNLVWEPGQIRFCLDEEDILQTNIVPSSPLSLVIWVDNQYAALPPKGRLRYGTLPNPQPAWMEIRDFELLDHV